LEVCHKEAVVKAGCFDSMYQYNDQQSHSWTIEFQLEESW